MSTWLGVGGVVVVAEELCPAAKEIAERKAAYRKILVCIVDEEEMDGGMDIQIGYAIGFLDGETREIILQEPDGLRL